MPSDSAYGIGYSRYKVWERQKRPWTKPLPYSASRHFWKPINGQNLVTLAYQAKDFGLFPEQRTWSFLENTATLNAYERFKGKARDSASLGVSLAEGRQSFNMIATRLGQMRSALKSLKQGRPGDALNALGAAGGIGQARGIKRGSKTLADSWLELHFGWSPLIADIYSAAKAITSDIPWGRVVGSGSAFHSFRVNREGQGGVDHRNVGVGFQSVSVRIQSRVAVTNPNLHLAEKMGLINPLSVAWELVPWSFLVDWFYPVGSFLDNLSFGAGMSFEDSFTTTKVSTFYDGNMWLERTWPDESGFDSHSDRSESNEIYRRLGMPEVPKPVLRLDRPSWKRAVTAMSLWRQQLDQVPDPIWDRVNRFNNPVRRF